MRDYTKVPMSLDRSDDFFGRVYLRLPREDFWATNPPRDGSTASPNSIPEGNKILNTLLKYASRSVRVLIFTGYHKRLFFAHKEGQETLLRGFRALRRARIHRCAFIDMSISNSQNGTLDPGKAIAPPVVEILPYAIEEFEIDGLGLITPQHVLQLLY